MNGESSAESMTFGKPLSELFFVDTRFRRSVNLAADHNAPGALGGYVITPLIRDVLARIVAGLAPGALNRAWSVTGPYGAGKSAFAVLACRLLGYPVDKGMRQKFRREEPTLYEELVGQVPGLECGGYLMVPAVGSRQPLTRTLLAGLLEAVERLGAHTKGLQRQRGQLAAVWETAKSGDVIVSDAVIKVIDGVARAAAKEVPGVLGLVVVYDELGKSLEYAALHPNRADVGVLQELAEYASRSVEPPVGLVTILHQAFEHYASFVGPAQRREWEKVQGRFTDVVFLQTDGELLSLVDRAIRRSRAMDGLEEIIAEEARRAEALRLLPRDLERSRGREVLAGCAPLHPSVALVLGRLFRSRLAQNERSLFAFLSSGEPYGFQEYLRTESWQGDGHRPFYRLDRLYDYVLAALGSGVYVHAQGKRWAEIAEALDRLPVDSEALDARLVKVIGMLGLLGDQRDLKASRDVLVYALADGETTPEEIDEAIKRLERASILVYRRFKEAYSLWQGSDVDLDECYERGRAQVEGLDLAATFAQHGQLKPYVAKRHLHETGTFRYLMPWVVDLEDIDTVKSNDSGNAEFGDADGAMVFVLPPMGTSFQQACDSIRSFSLSLPPSQRTRMLFAIPHSTQGIRESLEELEAWRWVVDNIAELEGDSTARRELKARQLAAMDRLSQVVSRCFDPSSSYECAIWILEGQVLPIASARQLATTVSEMCDRAYNKAPIVKNELVNRRSLSSAAAAARRNLVEAMLLRNRYERLGIEGYPPEASMYLSVLEASGIHQRVDSEWGFGPPQGDDPYRVRPLWEAMDEFLATTEGEAKPIITLYRLLKAPPFGIREGLLPIYLVAGMLHWSSEIALYEEGTFIPQVGVAELERLLRVPERFTIQRYRLNDARSRLIDGLARLFSPETEPGQASVLDNVRMLIGFITQLPGYARLTDSLSDDAKAVRMELLRAREPQTLLFRTLPEALGFQSLDDGPVVDTFLERLRGALLELQTAYATLLEHIRAELVAALRLPPSLKEARDEIRQRASIVQDYVSDMQLRAFLFRLQDDQLPDREWLESVASLTGSKPPRNWGDSDVRGFRTTLAHLAAQLQRAEEVALSQQDIGNTREVMRLAVTDVHGREYRDLLSIRPDREGMLHQAADALEQTLEEMDLDEETRLAVLAMLVQRLLGRQTAAGEGEHDDARTPHP